MATFDDLDAVPPTSTLKSATAQRPKQTNKRPPTRKARDAAAASSNSAPMARRASGERPAPKRRFWRKRQQSSNYEPSPQAIEFADPGSQSEGEGTGDIKGKRHKTKKKGHRRVDKATGEVSYKKVKSSELMQAIQMGIRQAIGHTMQRRKRDLLVQDFDEVESQYYPREGTSTTPAHRYESFKFYSYAPLAYRHFRDAFNIDTRDFLMSMCDTPMRELSNPGASGSLFWLSGDDIFIVKTVQKGESRFLRRLLSGYHLNLMQNKRTLLPKFFGHFCYKSNTGKHIRFIVMQNILPSHLTYSERYDLKGSKKGRFASEKELRKKSPTLKDLDFERLHARGLRMTPEVYDKLVGTIERDIRVLESFQIMDYSLLLGVHQPGKDLDTLKSQSRLGSTSAHQLTVRAKGTDAPVHMQLCEISQAPAHLSRLNGTYRSKNQRTTDGRFRFTKVVALEDTETSTDPDEEVVFLMYTESDERWRLCTDPTGQDTLAYLPSAAMLPDSDQASWKVRAAADSNDNDDTSSDKTDNGFTVYSRMASKCSEGPALTNSTSKLTRHNSVVFQTVTASDGPVSPSDAASMSDGGLVAYTDQGDKVYLFVGIIDILQNYGTKKALEHNYKAMIYNGDEVSVHNPKFYRQRFQNFMSGRVFESDPTFAADGAPAPAAAGRPSTRQNRLRRRQTTNASQQEEERNNSNGERSAASKAVTFASSAASVPSNPAQALDSPAPSIEHPPSVSLAASADSPELASLDPPRNPSSVAASLMTDAELQAQREREGVLSLARNSSPAPGHGRRSGTASPLRVSPNSSPASRRRAIEGVTHETSPSSPHRVVVVQAQSGQDAQTTDQVEEQAVVGAVAVAVAPLSNGQVTNGTDSEGRQLPVAPPAVQTEAAAETKTVGDRLSQPPGLLTNVPLEVNSVDVDQLSGRDTIADAEATPASMEQVHASATPAIASATAVVSQAVQGVPITTAAATTTTAHDGTAAAATAAKMAEDAVELVANNAGGSLPSVDPRANGHAKLLPDAAADTLLDNNQRLGNHTADFAEPEDGGMLASMAAAENAMQGAMQSARQDQGEVVSPNTSAATSQGGSEYEIMV
eukprot:TRINITY_DN12142_c0_g1_i4.p1 TRINITY_DN12142_c0_g1~~TRINITY_DN12142_c0_g1_i4.p1  ORF type:complete len:1092 (+),score=278.89 TRINITY_DN12142_c0_g1_i4:155-3430(+)